MTPAGMTALRIAATLAHALPGVRVRLRDGDRTLLEVAKPRVPANGSDDGDERDETGGPLGACAFRMAVSRAYRQTKTGLRIGFVGLGEQGDPAVDVGMRDGDRVLPGGIYRVTIGDQTVHAFATTLSPRQCRRLLAEPGCVAVAEAIRLHHDAATDVTLVHTVSHQHGLVDRDRRRIEKVLPAFVADEVTHELAAASRGR